MTAPRFTHAAAGTIAANVQKALEAGGIPKDLIRVTAHEDVRDGAHHQTYIHVEAWAPGTGLAAELDAAEDARKAAAKAEADAAKAAAKAAKKADA